MVVTHDATSRARIRSTPPIKDPRELSTIITSSLRSLFGDCQPYSFEVDVIECRSCSNPDQNMNNSFVAIIECPSSSLDYVRAALTFSSTPSYLEGEIYRLDYIETISPA